jgi:hypothetical protein
MKIPVLPVELKNATVLRNIVLTDCYSNIESINILTNLSSERFYCCRGRSRWCNGYRASHWTQGSRVQTRPRAMDF